MDKLIRKTLCRPVNQVDELDCAMNWETFDCIGCDGAGKVRDDFPESESYGEECDCCECDGSGQVAILKR